LKIVGLGGLKIQPKKQRRRLEVQQENSSGSGCDKGSSERNQLNTEQTEEGAREVQEGAKEVEEEVEGVEQHEVSLDPLGVCGV